MDNLREMILYVVEQVPIEDLNHLCCVLYLIDLQAYHQLGHSISGIEYIRGKEVPEPKGIRDLLIDMIAVSQIDVDENFLKNS